MAAPVWRQRSRTALRGLRGQQACGWFETLESRELLTSTAVITFETTDNSGNLISAIPVGGIFQLREIVQDTSGNGASGGIFSAYVNASYDSTLASIPSDAHGPVVSFGPLYSQGTNENTQTAGLLIDTGAFTPGIGNHQPLGSAPQLLFTIPVTATTAGTETFTPLFDTNPVSQITEFGDNSALSAAQVTFVPATISIVGDQPTIVVSSNGQSIADGSTTNSAAQGTDFGTRQVGGSALVETYTIANNGGAPLTLGQVTLAGANAGDFSVLTQPSGTVAPGTSTTFAVQFVAGALGARTATVSFSQDDPRQTTPFTFAIGGAGTTGQLVVTGLGQVIADGDLTASAADGTDFGVAPPGNSPVIETYTLTNTGHSLINIASLTFSGANAADFSIGTPPATPVPPGQAVTFTIAFLPAAGASGVRTATLNINDDDSTQPSPFTFTISGVAQAAAIAVSGNRAPIDAGDTTTSLLNGTQFGTSFVNAGGGTGQTFTITNHGLVPLNIGTVTLSADSGGDFTVGKQPDQTVPPGGLTTFTISFIPSAVGARSAVVNFTQSDPGQLSPFSFAVGGSGLAVANSGLASVTFEATDSSGNVLSSVPVGTNFQLRAIVQDTSGRGANGGVFETYVNASYNAALASIPSDAKTPVATFGPYYINGQSENTQTAGTLADMGAFAGTPTAPPFTPGSAPLLLFTLPVTATAAGTETFSPSLATSSGEDGVLLFGDDNALTASQVTFVPVSINITGGSPTIAVSASGQSIADGSTAPSVANDTDFGSLVAGAPSITQTYTIANSGTGLLTVGNVSIGGTDSGAFTITSQPANSVAPGGSTTFTVKFQPQAGGPASATVSFSDNDTSQTSPFSFAIGGDALVDASIADASAVTAPDDQSQSVNAVFTVTLSGSSSQIVTVNYATVDGTAVAGTDYRAANGTLTFPPGITNEIITVAVNGTLFANPTEHFQVALSQPSGAIVTGSPATGSILNNNVPTWSNPVNSDDVNADGVVTPIDVLVIVNDINSNGAGTDTTPPEGKHSFLDVNKDGVVSPLDPLAVINEINGVVQVIATAQASNAVPPSANSTNAVSSPSISASSAAPAPVVATVAPTTQLADLAFAVYNGEDLSLAVSSLPAGRNGSGRRPN